MSLNSLYNQYMSKVNILWKRVYAINKLEHELKSLSNREMSKKIHNIRIGINRRLHVLSKKKSISIT